MVREGARTAMNRKPGDLPSELVETDVPDGVCRRPACVILAHRSDRRCSGRIGTAMVRVGVMQQDARECRRVPPRKFPRPW